jgi:hypothetical protein
VTQLQADGLATTGKATSSRRSVTRLIGTGLVSLAIVVLLGFVAIEAQALYREWTLLQFEAREVKRHGVIGFQNIAPIGTYARAPSEWYRDDGEASLLWWQWEEGVGHKWFRFIHGQIDPERIVRPTPHFISRAVDYPLVENNGGPVWQRIPSDSQVVGVTLQGQPCVYPVLLLNKVQVINDLVADHPFLIVVNLFPNADQQVSVFDAEHAGHRLTMATTGYFHDRKPMLYDRGTQSLWVEHEDGLKAIAGKRKDDKLTLVTRLTPVSWDTWLNRNRQSRLLVGADRSQGVPNE